MPESYGLAPAIRPAVFRRRASRSASQAAARCPFPSWGPRMATGCPAVPPGTARRPGGPSGVGVGSGADDELAGDVVGLVMLGVLGGPPNPAKNREDPQLEERTFCEAVLRCQVLGGRARPVQTIKAMREGPSRNSGRTTGDGKVRVPIRRPLQWQVVRLRSRSPVRSAMPGRRHTAAGQAPAE